uniref:NADH dehydrogenase subunit 3 n=1 Tax=Sulcionema specki TaxID=2016126 RepID=A0A6G5ZV27_9EUGL|nr:NADH dehydrogenase subunit 3 [Sulcionema specki]
MTIFLSEGVLFNVLITLTISGIVYALSLALKDMSMVIADGGVYNAGIQSSHLVQVSCYDNTIASLIWVLLFLDLEILVAITCLWGGMSVGVCVFGVWLLVVVIEETALHVLCMCVGLF